MVFVLINFNRINNKKNAKKIFAGPGNPTRDLCDRSLLRYLSVTETT